MIAPPTALLTEYTQTLQGRGIAVGIFRNCLKWFRYYWDFCAKYRLDPLQAASFTPFLGKLQAKNQTAAQLAEAKRAIEIFVQMNVIKASRSGVELARNEVEMPNVAHADHGGEAQVCLSGIKVEKQRIVMVVVSSEVAAQIVAGKSASPGEEADKLSVPVQLAPDG
ncbi:MAG: hypothetical protein V2B20_16085 [Pseudomonadota bacterium]